jgi:hypothetical protein
MCPSCGQNAPLVYRGVSAFCSACGQPRVPFTANAVSLKGKPAKIGGTVAAVAGWLLMFGSLAAALIVGAIFQALFPAAVLGWVLGGVIAAAGVGVSLLLLLGGRALRRSGTNAAESARLDALGTLAAHQRGNVTAQNASETLGCTYEEADAFLTTLAKRPDSGVSLEVDDDGKIYYRFARYAPPPVWPSDAKVRVDAITPGGARAPTVLAQASVPPPAAPAPRVVTEGMPEVPAHVRVPPIGPEGTKVVPVYPATGQPGAPPGEPEVVSADEADPRRARS